MSVQGNSKVYPIVTAGSLKRTPTGSVIEKENKSARCLTDELCTFTGETTLHGIRFVGDRSNCFARRCIWGIAVVSTVCLLCNVLKESVINFNSYPVATKISTSYNSEIAFPAVTFCNYNQLRKSQINEEEMELLNNILNGLPFGNFNDTNMNVTEFVLRVSHRIEDLLTQCLWMSIYPCGPENFTTHIYDFGVCYTFKTTLNVTNAGVTSALFMQININDTENTGHQYGLTGLKMMIHPSNERPLVAAFGFAVSPGFHTEVALRGVQVKSLPYPFQSKCRTKRLRYTNVYTKALCIEECRFDYVIGECGCKVSVMNGDVRECGVQEAMECGYPSYDRFVSDNNVTCDCPVACEQLTFEPRISTTLWPDPVMIERFEKNDGYPKEYVRENILQVRISFEDLDMTVTELVSSYTLVQLLSEIGGCMGLLCGMSALTLAEFIDFAVVAFLQRILNR